MASRDPDTLFVPAANGAWLPTAFSRGPWSPEALHGGPVAALLARAVEPELGELQPVRVTVELLRPVPHVPLHVTAVTERPGRKVRLASASIAADGAEVARATALAIRTANVPVEGAAIAPRPRLPSDATEEVPPDTGYAAFHNAGVEHAFVRGRFGQPGPATDWIRLRVPVVPDEVPSPLQRTMAAADFGNGISGVRPFAELVYINPDLTVYLHRLPEGEWVCLDAVTSMEQNGIAMAESRLFDERGPVGRAVQSLIVDFGPGRDSQRIGTPRVSPA
jgi:hypothetical protein